MKHSRASMYRHRLMERTTVSMAMFDMIGLHATLAARGAPGAGGQEVAGEGDTSPARASPTQLQADGCSR